MKIFFSFLFFSFLFFHTDAVDSRMFGSALEGARVMKTLKDQAVTLNMHQKCVTPEVGHAQFSDYHCEFATLNNDF